MASNLVLDNYNVHYGSQQYAALNFANQQNLLENYGSDFATIGDILQQRNDISPYNSNQRQEKPKSLGFAQSVLQENVSGKPSNQGNRRRRRPLSSPVELGVFSKLEDLTSFDCGLAKTISKSLDSLISAQLFKPTKQLEDKTDTPETDENSGTKNHSHPQPRKLSLTNDKNLFCLTQLLDELLRIQLDFYGKSNSFSTLGKQNLSSEINKSTESGATDLNNNEVKTGKRPKTVRFADCCGLDLTEIREYQPFPKLDFTVREETDNEFLQTNQPIYQTAKKLTKTLLPLFFLPPSNAALVLKALEKNVQLESTFIHAMVLHGSILVANLSFTKEIYLRFSFDNWSAFEEISADYCGCVVMENIRENSVDRFTFTISFESSDELSIGGKVCFCVRFLSDLGEFWDNNEGLNYSLKLVET